MRARKSSQRTRDDLEFPIRLRVKMPRNASKGLTELIPFWLQAHLGRNGFAQRSMKTDAGPREMFYFRQLEAAQAFITAFPELELANETAQVDASGDWVRAGNASARG